MCLNILQCKIQKFVNLSFVSLFAAIYHKVTLCKISPLYVILLEVEKYAKIPKPSKNTKIRRLNKL